MKRLSGLLGLACILISGSALAGNLGGSFKVTSAVAPGYTQSWDLVFDATPGFILVDGDGSSKFVCVLADKSGIILQKTSGRTDGCLLSVFPSHITKYTLMVGNVGERADEFTVKTN